MNYDHAELQMRLAAEYALGTLQGPARRRFERLLSQDQVLRQRVEAWQQRLTPWAAALRPAPVPAGVWTGIQQRLGHAAPATAGNGWWRWWAWGSTALAGALALVLLFRPAPPAPVAAPAAPVFTDLAVLSSSSKDPAWIVRVDAGRRTLQLSGLAARALPPGKALELWAIPAEGAPLSLGVLPLHQGRAELALDAAHQARLHRATVLAISLEPTGGSPTGAPTGPVLYTGKPAPV